MPSPIDYLDFQTKMQPKGIAIQRMGGAVTYRQLTVMVRQVAGKLRQAGIRPGNVVATFLPDSQLDWVVTLALCHEAAVSCAVIGDGTLDPALGVDYLVTTRLLPSFASDKTILIDPAWEQAAMAEAADVRPIPFADGNALCRLVLTSGTTGHSRAVPLSLASIQLRMARMQEYWSSSGREMILMGLSSVGGFFTALNSLVAGSPFFVPYTMAQAIELIYQHKVTSLIGAPTQLAALMDGIAASSLTIAFKALSCFGSRLTMMEFLVLWAASADAPKHLIGLIDQKGKPYTHTGYYVTHHMSRATHSTLWMLVHCNFY